MATKYFFHYLAINTDSEVYVYETNAARAMTVFIFIVNIKQYKRNRNERLGIEILDIFQNQFVPESDIIAFLN